MSFFKIMAMGLVAAFALTACGVATSQEETLEVVQEEIIHVEPSPENAAEATNSHWPQTLSMAILVGDNNQEAQEAEFNNFRTALEAYIGIPVETVPGLTHLIGIESMRAGNLHLMWGSPFVYLLAQQTMDVERLVVTDSPNAINRALFVTSQEDIVSMEDIVGRSFAFVTPASASGFLYPMYHLINTHNMSRDQILSPGELFGEVAFSGSNNASIVGAYHGDFDVAAVGHIQFHNAINSGLISDNIRIIGHTEDIPWPGYIARTDLPQDLRDMIQSFMLGWASEDYSLARWNDADVRYAAPDAGEIQHLRGMVEVLDIDLEEQG